MTRSTLARLFDCVTIPALRRRTVSLWPDREAFRQFDYADNRWISLTWKAFEAQVLRWRHAFYASGLKPGDRAAMLLTNSIEAVIFDQAALAAGLIPVPLHAVDTPGSSAYILHDSGARILVTSSRARWNALHAAAGETLPMLEQVVLLNELDDEVIDGVRISGVETWLARGNGTPSEALPPEPSPDDLAGLIYPSGTTGRPKGVMLTHANLVANVAQISDAVEITESDIYLSFLPFSHTFERTVAHYAALAHGASMAFARSVQHIENDLADVQPTIMCTVPRVLERLYQKQQLELAKGSEVEQHRSQWAAEAGWRRFCRDNGLPIEPSAREALDETVLPVLDEDVGRKVRGLFGGRMKAILCGGASLNQSVARYFCAMGVPLRQVYGLTETSPIVSLTRAEMNHPACVGQPVAQTQVRLGDRDELQVKGPQVMQGYWNKPAETKHAFTEDGWFHTGDQADLSDGGRVRIKGRIKEIIVTSTGEKIAPVDLEFAIQEDPLFEQVFVCGENRPFISAVLVLQPDLWKALCAEMELSADDPQTLHDRSMLRYLVKRVRAAAKDFPSYGIPRSIAVADEPFTVENGLLTPTMKLRREKILSRWKDLIDGLYSGHPAA